jgi:hypothetical protein
MVRDEIVSIADILSAISDDKSLLLFNSVALSNSQGNDIVLSRLKLKRKQYYPRISKLVKANLVNRRNGKYFLTNLGKIVYDAQIIIEKAVVDHCKLELVDALKSDQMPKEEYNMNIYDLIDNERIREELIIKNRSTHPLTDQGIKEGAKRNHNEH